MNVLGCSWRKTQLGVMFWGFTSRSIAWCNVSVSVLTLLTERQCLVQWVSRSSVSLMESRANGGGCKPTERCAWWRASAKVGRGGRTGTRTRKPEQQSAQQAAPTGWPCKIQLQDAGAWRAHCGMNMLATQAVPTTWLPVLLKMKRLHWLKHKRSV